VAGSAGLAALACNGDDEKVEEEQTSAGAGSPAAAATKTPKKGGTLIVDAGEPVPSALVFAFNAANVYLRWGIWDSLVFHGNDNRPQLMLAERFEMKPDFTGVHIVLRPGLEFHNGRKLTAEDVRFSIEIFRADSTSSQLKKGGQMISEIKVADDRTLDVSFIGPRPLFEDYFSLLPIVDKDTVEQHLQMKVLNGAGPFKFVSYTPQQGYVMERNPTYWDSGRPYLDRIQGKIYADDEARTLAIQTGELLHTTAVTYQMVKKLKGNKDVSIEDDGISGIFYAGMVVTHPPLRDVRVRRALTLAIDRERIAREWGEGVIEPAVLPWPKDAPAYIAEDAALLKYDPEQAKALIKQAGVEGLTLPMEINPLREDLAQFVQDMWKAVGINPRIELIEPATYNARARSRRIETTWVGNAGGGNVMHPATFFGLSDAVAPPNTSYYEPEHYKDLLAKMVEADPRSPSGRELIRRWNRLWLIDEPWMAPLAPMTAWAAMGKHVVSPGGNKGPGKRPPVSEMSIDA
jgi:peptide/nickel transport system substrate-binding protein